MKLDNLTLDAGRLETIVPHGLAYIPEVVVITPKGDLIAWESTPADATNIYLTGSVSGTVKVYVLPAVS